MTSAIMSAWKMTRRVSAKPPSFRFGPVVTLISLSSRGSSIPPFSRWPGRVQRTGGRRHVGRCPDRCHGVRQESLRGADGPDGRAEALGGGISRRRALLLARRRIGFLRLRRDDDKR